MRKSIFFILIGLLSFTDAFSQHVSAYQAGSYQPGLLNIRDLATPGAGLVFIDYNYWNNSNSYYNQFGDKVTHLEIDLSSFDPAKGKVTLDLEPQISGYINVPVFFYASKFKIFHGRYLASISPVYLSSNSTMNLHTSDTSVVAKGNAGGFGDLAFMPLGLAWSIHNKMDISFFYTIYAPTGRYKTGAEDNVGKGYWTHQFQIPFYLYFFDKTTALFVMPTVEINGKIKGSDVRPGSRLTIEYGISQYITPWLELEILNGHNRQISDDKGKDVWWRDTPLYAKDQTSTVSFGVGVWPWAGKLNIRVKYAMDYGTKQRYKSNFLSASIIFIPNILAEKAKE